ncbi:hypothetical protein GGI25_001132 [Coemansia spiralis]|uniref:Uncharacterized protein n=2 Tax=Coemansia TaxID=4863 RepID=A0A9W8GB40_9FUNG|nr:hypothetical protein BX070DRAFT_64282 [Coemansia spiralis]KAJ1995565.1 hypothetical protein EDC05_000803 [Coemansia umbellata]KAJ2625103.1 hypothetical protein GGI26_000906 [Coemansia sp. RSA 1358]KAJ2679943.1 hypothetical protein GGI25_001132 [Coemansia spiralis]
MTSTSRSSAPNGSSDQQAMHVYELETTIAQLRDSNSRYQQIIERLEKDHQHAADELESLNKTHTRLESQLFETESELSSTSSRLDRAQRSNATLQSTLESRIASLEREREAWKKRESELQTELVAAKRKATIQRRQTVSATSSHARSGSIAGSTTSRMSMYAHDMPGANSLSPLTQARATVREAADHTGDGSFDSANQDLHSLASGEQLLQMQSQIRQLTRKLREAEDRAQHATDQATRIHMEAEHALGSMDAYQMKIESLESTVKQLTELNESLREDNESYQVLLQMSTMKGGFSFGNNARASLDSRSSSGRWAVTPGAAEDGTYEGTAANMHAELSAASNMPGSPDIGLDLASELGQALSLDDVGNDAGNGNGIGSGTMGDADGHAGYGYSMQARMAGLEEQVTQLKEDLRKTKYERRHLSEENKALSLYVNKILSRIMASSDGLEAILSRDYDTKSTKPKPPITSFATPTKHSRKDSQTQKPEAISTQQPPLLPEQGSGDGITSVFIPPTSPTIVRVNRQLPPLAQEQQPQSPPPYTRRTRSATVAAGATPDIKLENKAANAATISSGSNSGGTWWKRMSVLRLGSAWGTHEESPTE